MPLTGISLEIEFSVSNIQVLVILKIELVCMAACLENIILKRASLFGLLVPFRCLVIWHVYSTMPSIPFVEKIRVGFCKNSLLGSKKKSKVCTAMTVCGGSSVNTQRCLGASFPCPILSVPFGMSYSHDPHGMS